MAARILIVDDSAFMRSRIRRRIREAGMEVAGEAREGDEAATRYAELRPDVVSMDLTMRGTDGIEGSRSILEIDPQAKIVLFSIVDDQEVLERARASGVLEIVHKSRMGDLIDHLKYLADKTGAGETGAGEHLAGEPE